MDENNGLPEDDKFQEIVSQTELENEEEDEELTPWDLAAELWPTIVPNSVVVKGLAIVEYIDADGRKLRWVASPGMAEWDLIGFLESALGDIRSQSMLMMLAPESEWVTGDDDFGDEDE